ncbi:kinesin-like protein, partial [Marasmius crinis-equi]
MSTTTMHFGPEWMRPKQQSVSRTQPPPPSPPPAAIPQTPNASSYSALVSPAPPAQPEKRDEAHPFRYSKEEMLRIYKEGGKGGLGLEVERWEGVVREVGTDPIGLREMGDAEKKLFTNSLNSDLRRRQSNDYLNLNTQNLERPRLTHSSTGSATGSPLRERYGSMGIIPRRRDSTDQAPTLAPRKLSLSGQQPLGSPRDVGLPSPRRLGHTPSFDGVLNGGESWVARRRASEGLGKIAGVTREPSGEENEIREEEEEGRAEADKETKPQETSVPLAQSGPPTEGSGIALQRPEDITNGIAQLS